jgi:MFS family permease
MTPTAPSVPAASPQHHGIAVGGWRIVLLASLGGTLEFYDFVIFGIFARDIAAAVFPSGDPLVSLMASFATFAVGYLVRPLGGLVLSHYGDRYGRRRVFLLSIFVMSAATFGMGLVPPYASWGAAAAALMVGLRLVQGFCLGGELPGALTYVVETAPRQAPFVCGVVFACVTMGVAAATAVSLGVRTWLDPETAVVYGWRIAFVIGGLGGILSYLLRQSLEESPEFARMRGLASRQPFRELLRTHPVPVMVGVAVLAATGTFNGLFFAHLLAYLSGVLKYDATGSVVAHLVGVVVCAVSLLASGWLAERVPPRYILRAGAVLLLALSYPFYAALEARAMNLTLLLSLAGICSGLSNGTFAVLLTDLFPTRIRFTGVALVFNLGFTVFSGTAPLAATALIRDTGQPTAPWLLMAGASIAALAGSWFVERYGGNVLQSSALRASRPGA